MKLNLSICLITKNEVANIERCLASIEKIAQEIVVIDTGSTDQTKRLCQQYTNKVFDYQWQDDFAAARNLP
uniref:CAZy families GT2 protein n=2 Tax=Bacteria TaxID=2 RepID=A0A060CDD1_9FIRM|nr:CAZy families GT2 protein [uncultured Alkaliphilus sp.]